MVFDPTETGNRKIKIKIGDAVNAFNDLPYISDYDSEIVRLETLIENVLPTWSTGEEGYVLRIKEDGTGIEWAQVKEGAATFADLTGDPRDNAALKTELETLEDAIEQTLEDAKDYADEKLAEAKAYTDEKVAEIKKIKYEVVDTLPTPSADVEFNKSLTIYLQKATGKDYFVEYICINDGTTEAPEYKWEAIGTTDIDLSEYRKAAEQDVIDESIRAEITKKVNKEIIGANGKAEIFNEADGGGAKFTNNDGVESFVGVNDGGENGLVAQIYADKLINGKWTGAKLDVTNGAMYYTVGDKSFAERAVEKNEIATKGDIEDLKFDVIYGGNASGF